MRTNIEIDDALLEQATKVSKAETKTKRAVVEEALQLLVRIRAQEALRELFGKGGLREDYDYKAMRVGSPKANASKFNSAIAATRRAANSPRGTRKRTAWSL